MPQQGNDMVLTLEGLTELVKQGSAVIREITAENEELRKFARSVDILSRLEKVGMAPAFPSGLSLSQKAERMARLPGDQLEKLAFLASQAQREIVLGKVASAQSSEGRQYGGLTEFVLSQSTGGV